MHEYNFACCFFCVDVELGFSHCGWNTPRVFENRVLRKICGPRRDEVTGERTRLHNEELYDL